MLIRGSTLNTLADQINAMKPGQRYKVSRYALSEIGSDLHRSALERLRERIVGSAHADIWKITEDMKGNVTFERLKP